jgi:hypothetical protein
MEMPGDCEFNVHNFTTLEDLAFSVILKTKVLISCAFDGNCPFFFINSLRDM